MDTCIEKADNVLERSSLLASKKRCIEYRKSVINLSQQVPALHIGATFSCLEIMDVIYFFLMQKNADGKFTDTFILSKGHGCIAQYIILNKLGILCDSELANFCLPGGCLGAHPDLEIPGVSASTGSLGHGLGLAIGMCYANKIKKLKSKTYVIISDGELQEGSVWEAIMMASNLGLDNLVVFLDLNDRISQEKISVKYPALYPIENKLKAFNWEVETVDGHRVQELLRAGKKVVSGKPLFIVCNTIKGKGVSFMEDVPIWHYRSPDKNEYQLALEELNRQLLEITT